MTGEQSTRSVERALQLLGAVSDGGTLSLAAAARAADLSPSTALRLLRTLQSAGFVRRDPDGAFLPGPRLMQIGARAFGDESLVEVTHVEMAGLAEATGESVYLCVPGHAQTALYIAIVEGSHSIRHASWVGRTIPLEGSATGIALSGQTPQRGYVLVEHGIEPDVTALASPLVAAGRVVAAVSILVPSYRMSPTSAARCGALLSAAARRLSAGLTDGTALQEHA